MEIDAPYRVMQNNAASHHTENTLHFHAAVKPNWHDQRLLLGNMVKRKLHRLIALRDGQVVRPLRREGGREGGIEGDVRGSRQNTKKGYIYTFPLSPLCTVSPTPPPKTIIIPYQYQSTEYHTPSNI